MIDALSVVMGVGVFPEERSFVPSNRAVVAPEVLARVFADSPLPFKTNSDGSVDMSVYAEWLENTWTQGMEEFEAGSALALPKLRSRSTA